VDFGNVFGSPFAACFGAPNSNRAAFDLSAGAEEEEEIHDSLVTSRGTDLGTRGAGAIDIEFGLGTGRATLSSMDVLALVTFRDS